MAIFEFTAIRGDVLSVNPLDVGAAFTMPIGDTVRVTVEDNDTVLDGDLFRNETGDDSSQIFLDDGSGVGAGSRIYAERRLVVRDADGQEFTLLELERSGGGDIQSNRFYTFVGPVPDQTAVLTVISESNAIGDVAQFDDLNGGVSFVPNANGEIIVEAEDLTLNGYITALDGGASGGEVIAVAGATGDASIIFGGETQSYIILVDLVDAVNGASEVALFVNGQLVTSVVLDFADVETGNLERLTVAAPERVLAQGDLIEILGFSDGQDSAIVDRILFVENNGPEANPDLGGLLEDVDITVDVLFNDVDADEEQLFVVEAGGQPAGETATVISEDGRTGLVEVNANGQLTFRTNDGFDDLAENEIDTVIIDYTIVNESGAFDSSTLTLEILGVNDAPVADDFLGVTSEDETLDGQLAAFDIEGDELVFALDTGAETGTVTVNADGSFSYDPDQDFNGQDSFTFTVSDGLATVVGNATIDVTPANDAPEIDEENSDLSFEFVEDGVGVVPGQGALGLRSCMSPISLMSGSYDNGYPGWLGATAPGAPVEALDPSAGGVLSLQPVTGTIFFADPDLGDQHTVEIVDIVSFGGNGFFDLIDLASLIAVDNVDSVNGEIDFTFTANNDLIAAFNTFGEGEIADISFTVRVTDDGDPELFDETVVSVLLTGVNDAPVAPPAFFNGVEDQVVNGQLLADDAEGDALTFALESDATFGSVVLLADGSFTYTPPPDFDGPATFTYTVTDGDATISQFGTIFVDPVNDAPVAVDDFVQTDEDTPFNDNVILGLSGPDFDIDGDILSVVAVEGQALVSGQTLTLSSGALLTMNDDGSFVYDPNGQFDDVSVGATNVDVFTYTISDGVLTSQALVEVEITGLNDAPVGVPDDFSTGEDDLVSENLLANDQDVDSASLEIVDGGDVVLGDVLELATENGRVAFVDVLADGTVFFDAFGGFDDLSKGETDSFSFDYIAQDADGANSEATTVTITVLGENDAPVIDSGFLDQTVSLVDDDSVQGADPDGFVRISSFIDFFDIDALDTHTLTFDSVTATGPVIVGFDALSAMTVDIIADGSAAFTFAIDEDLFKTLGVGELAEFEYELTISDDAAGTPGTDTATFTVELFGANDAPEPDDLAVSGDEDTNITGTVTAFDLDGDTLTFSDNGQPANGAVVINGDGTFTYTPAENFNGVDTFSFSADDGFVSRTGTVTVTVDPVNDAPQAIAPVIIPANSVTTFGVGSGVIDNTNDGAQHAIAALQGGGFVTVDRQGPGQATGLTIFDSFGSEISATEVSETVDSSNDGGQSVAVLNDGDIVALTVESRNTLIARIFNPDGTGQSVDFIVDDNNSTFVDGSPSVSATTDGGFVVVWAGNVNVPQLGTIDGVFARRFDGAGQEAQSTIRLDGIDTTDVNHTDVVGLSGGGFAAAYILNNLGTFEALMTIVDAAGNIVAQDVLAASPVITANGARPSITELANGDIVMAYEALSPTGGATGFFSIFGSDGTPVVGPVQAVDFSGGDALDGQRDIDVLGLPDGGFVVAFANDRLQTTNNENGQVIPSGIVIRQFDQFGSPLGDPDHIATGQKPEIALMPNGNVALISLATNNQINVREIELASNPFIVAEDDSFLFEGLAVDDVDIPPGGLEELTVTLGVQNGLLEFVGSSDATVVGDLTDELTITGTVDEVNDVLGGVLYAPDFNFFGNDTLAFEVTDATALTDQQSLTIIVTSVNDAPVGDNLVVSGNEDEVISGTLTANDLEGDTLTFSLDAEGANGTTVINGDGTFTYTPDENFDGIDQVFYTVDDGNGGTDLGFINVTIDPVNDAPVLTNNNAAFFSGSTANFAELSNFADIPTTAITISTFVRADSINPQNVLFTYGDAGDVDSLFMRFDSDGTTIFDFNGTSVSAVTNIGDGAFHHVLGTIDTITGEMGFFFDGVSLGTATGTPGFSIPTAGTLILGHDQDAPGGGFDSGEALSGDLADFVILDGVANGATIAQLGAGVVDLNDPNVVLSGQYDEDGGGFIDGTGNGNDILTNGSLPQVAGPGGLTVSVLEDASVFVQVGLSDVDTAGGTVEVSISATDGTFTFSDLGGVTITSGANFTGQITFEATFATAVGILSSFEYEPDNDFNGADNIVVTVDDLGATGAGGAQAATLTIPVTVAAVNDAPVGDNQFVNVDEDDVFTGQLTADDVDGDIVTFSLGADDANGTTVINPDGSFTHTPDPDFNGVNLVTFISDDGNGGTDTGLLNFTVDPVNDVPEVTSVNALRFDDAATPEQRVTFADAPAFDTSVDFTVEAVVTTSDASAGINRVFSNPVGGLQTFSISIENGEYVFRVDAATTDAVVNGGFVADGAAHTLSATVESNGDVLVFVDGVQTGSGAFAGAVEQGAEGFTVGAFSAGVQNEDLNGDVHEVRFFDNLRSPAEIAANFDQQLDPVAETNLQLYATFDGNLLDSSQNGFAGTVVGAPEFVEGVAPADGQLVAIEDTPLELNNVRLADVDIDFDAGTDLVRLVVQVQNGVLTFNQIGLVDSVVTGANNSGAIQVAIEAQNAQAFIQDITYTPDADFTGNDLFTVALNDQEIGGGGQGAFTDTLNQTIVVNAVSDAPTGVDDNITISENTATQVDNVLANDIEPDAGDLLVVRDGGGDIDLSSTFTITSTGLRDVDFTMDSSGDLTIFTNGVFEDLGVGETDTVSVTYEMEDSTGAFGTATVTYTVEGENDAPTATAIDAGTNTEEDNPPPIDLLSTAVDVEDDALTLDGASITATNIAGDALTFSLSLNTFTLDAGQFEGLAVGETDTVTVTYDVTDGTVVSDNAGGVQTVPNAGRFFVFDFDTNTSTVVERAGGINTVADAAADAGVLNGVSFVVNPGSDFVSFGASTFESGVETVRTLDEFIIDNYAGGVDEFATFFNLTDSISNGSVTLRAVNVPTPDGGQLITTTISGIDFTDGIGNADLTSIDFTVESTVTNTATFDVTGVNDAPVAFDDTAITDEDVAVIIDVFGNDVDVDASDTLAFDVLPTAVNGSVVDNGDGTLTYTPDADFFGLDTFTYTVTDGNGGTDTGSISVTVNSVQDPVGPINLNVVGGGANDTGFVINGINANDGSHRATSHAGDINGDGLDDIVVGAYLNSAIPSNSGEAYVVFGKADGGVVELSDVAAGIGGFAIAAVAAGDQLGYSISGAGDVNGDGFDDLIVSAHQADPNGANSGESYVVYGKFDGAAVDLGDFGAGEGFTISGVAGNEFSGTSVSGINDLNGDGFDDLIISSPGTTGDDGHVHVVFGNATGTDVALSAVVPSAGLGFEILGADLGDRIGDIVSRAGDFNNDGIEDVIIGARFAEEAAVETGAAYVVFGKSDDAVIDLSNVEAGLGGGIAIFGAVDGDEAGISVSEAGDFNGDGIDDVIVGASGASANDGEAYIIFGSAGGGSNIDLAAFGGTSLGVVIDAGSFSGGNVGKRVSQAGDINGDGLEDIIIGAPLADIGGVTSGAAFVVYGTTSTAAINLDAIAAGNGGFIVEGTAATDETGGKSVEGGGDINGDGFDDIIVTVTNGPNGVLSGASTIIFGGDVIGASDANIVGDAAPNVLIGSDFDDRIIGGAGDDSISGGGGDDLLSGGAGSDLFIFNDGDGDNTIRGFGDESDPGQDVVDIAAFGFGVFGDVTSAMTAEGLNTRLTLDVDDSILFLDRDLDSFAAAEFLIGA